MNLTNADLFMRIYTALRNTPRFRDEIGVPVDGTSAYLLWLVSGHATQITLRETPRTLVTTDPIFGNVDKDGNLAVLRVNPKQETVASFAICNELAQKIGPCVLITQEYLDFEKQLQDAPTAPFVPRSLFLLGVMLREGVDILGSLSVLSDLASTPFAKGLFEDLGAFIRSGKRMGDFEELSEYWGEGLAALIAKAEIEGNLHAVLIESAKTFLPS